jgi:hypothetical protein
LTPLWCGKSPTNGYTIVTILEKVYILFFSQKSTGFSKMDKNKCPFSKSENTFPKKNKYLYTETIMKN